MADGVQDPWRHPCKRLSGREAILTLAAVVPLAAATIELATPGLGGQHPDQPRFESGKLRAGAAASVVVTARSHRRIRLAGAASASAPNAQ